MHTHTSDTHVRAALPGDEVVAAAAAARVYELLAHLGGGVVVVARDGGGAPAFVQRVQTEHGNSYGRATSGIVVRNSEF